MTKVKKLKIHVGHDSHNMALVAIAVADIGVPEAELVAHGPVIALSPDDAVTVAQRILAYASAARRYAEQQKSEAT